MKKELFRIHNGTITKNGTPILINIYLQVFENEMSGILFNSFEERNYLLSFFMGNIILDFGYFYFQDERIPESRQHKLIRQHFAVITEVSCLMKPLSISENILWTEYPNVALSQQQLVKKVRELYSFFNLPHFYNKPVNELSTLERAEVELMKAYIMGRHIVVLSNLASLLDFRELEELFGLIKILKEKGLSFVIVETARDTILEFVDNLTIIKDSRTVNVLTPENIDRHHILYSLGQNTFEPPSHQQEYRSTKQHPAIQFCNVTNDNFTDLNFSLERGNVLKILFDSNESMNHFRNLFYAPDEIQAGNILIDGNRFFADKASDLYAQGLGIIESNPRSSMLFHNLSVMENLCLPLSDKVTGFWMHHKYQKGVQIEMREILDKKIYKKPIAELPNSTLQKIIYGKWLLYSPLVVVCINPFSITDMPINEATRTMMNLYLQKGIAILILSTNWTLKDYIEGENSYVIQGELN